MRTLIIKFQIPLLSLISLYSFSQTNCTYYKNMISTLDMNEIIVNKEYYDCDTIYPFKDVNYLCNIFLTGKIKYYNDEGFVRIILTDWEKNNFLIFEGSTLTSDSSNLVLNRSFYETGALQNIIPLRIEVIVSNASIYIEKFNYYQFNKERTNDFCKLNDSLVQIQNSLIVKNINKKYYNNEISWFAGETEISKLKYKDKLRYFKSSLYSSNGIEFYKGGVFVLKNDSPKQEINDTQNLDKRYKIASKSIQLGTVLADNFDWRHLHSINWNTSVKNQGGCGGCWAFGAVAAVEGMVNLFYNTLINMDLSEQQLISCADPFNHNCSGGDPLVGMNYIKNHGVVDELTYPYIEKDTVCYSNFSPIDQIRINNVYRFNSGYYQNHVAETKKAIMTRGIAAMESVTMKHAMALVGFSIIYEHDSTFDINSSHLFDYTWGSVNSSSDLIGKTCWIVKNSWGSSWGYDGYGYFVCDIVNLGELYFAESPISLNLSEDDIIVEDKDGDGYYNWGISDLKPVNCPLSFDEKDSDDSNSSIGALYSDGTEIINDSYILGFESRSDQFIQSTDDIFNWKFGTHSLNPNSGPQAAYEGAIYLFAEPQHDWDSIAILIGPTIDLRNACGAKLKFNYHMFGSHIGTLALQITINDGLTWSSNIWSRTGNQGNTWLNDSIDLTPYLGSIIKYRVIAKTIPRNNDQIAIDNMVVYFNPGTIGTQTIQSNQVWNDIRYFCNNIELINNSSVSITGISVMRENSSIIVKNGSTLNIDGGQLLKAKVIIESGGTLNIQNAGRITLMDPNFLIVNMGGICNVIYGEIYSK
jgi:C1A family cysteine protease